jgi:hypothetical protein
MPPQLGSSLAFQSPSSSPRPSITPSVTNRIQLQPQTSPIQAVRRQVPTIIGTSSNHSKIIQLVPQSSTRPTTPSHPGGFVRIGAPTTGTPPVQRYVMLGANNPIVQQSQNQSQQ